MNVLVAGSDGFIGKAVVGALQTAGHSVRGLSRSAPGAKHFALGQVTADVTDPKTLIGVAEGCEAVIYLPGLIRAFPSKGITFEGVHVEGVQNLAKEANRAGVRRWLQMSALGVGRGVTSRYFKTKLKAEIFLQDKRLFELTVFRPSVVAPDRPSSDTNFVSDLVGRSRLLPFFPVIGGGKYRLQPIALGDVANAFVAALETSDSVGRTYELGGPDKLTMNEIATAIKQAAGLTKPTIHIPTPLIRPAAALLGRYSFFPVTSDQIEMLISENIVSPAHAGDTSELFAGKQLTPFATAVADFYR